MWEHLHSIMRCKKTYMSMLDAGGSRSTKSPTAPVEDAKALLQGMVPSVLGGKRMGAQSMVPSMAGGGRVGWPLAGLCDARGVMTSCSIEVSGRALTRRCCVMQAGAVEFQLRQHWTT